LLVGEQVGSLDAASPTIEAGGTSIVPQDASESFESGPPAADAGVPVRDASDLDVESPQCQALRAEIDKLRTAATVCDPSSTATQCGELAADVCCPIWVNSPPPPGAAQFEDTVAQYRSECHASCGANPCQIAQNSHCDSTGHCAWGPPGPSH
jgi:hypothetical protein